MKLVLIRQLVRFLAFRRKLLSSKSREKGTIPKELFKKFLPEDPVIVEAGAHVGSDTVEMSKLWPRGTIHAFEPVPMLYEKLKANTQGLKNVKCYPLALGDRTGIAKMFVSSGASDGSSSLLPPKEHLTEHPDVLFQTEIEVPVITLDDWAREHGIKRVDLLWLDMQGYELAALKAAPRILRSVCAIHTEVSLKEIYEGAPLYPEMRDWLESHGFRVEREELPWPDMGNVLFVRQGRDA